MLHRRRKLIFTLGHAILHQPDRALMPPDGRGYSGAKKSAQSQHERRRLYVSMCVCHISAAPLRRVSNDPSALATLFTSVYICILSRAASWPRGACTYIYLCCACTRAYVYIVYVHGLTIRAVRRVLRMLATKVIYGRRTFCQLWAEVEAIRVSGKNSI